MPASLLLVCGDDEFLVEEAALKHVAAHVPAKERATGLEMVCGRVETRSAVEAVKVARYCLEALRTDSLFGGGKLVWLRDANFLNPQTQPGKFDEVKAQVTALVDCLKQGVPAGQGLLISSTQIPRNSALFKVCQTGGKVIDLGSGGKTRDVEQRAAKRLEDELARAGLRMSSEVRQNFIERTGAAIRHVVQEVEKLDVYLGPSRRDVAAADVDAVVSSSRESRGWDVTDALGERDAKTLMRVLRRLQAQDESMIGLATMAETRVRDLLVLREAMDRGWLTVKDGDRGGWCAWASPLPPEADALLSALPTDKKGKPRDPRGMEPYQLKKPAQQAKNYTLNELRRARHVLLDLREKLVSSSLPEDFLVETALLRVVRREKASVDRTAARR